MPFEVLLLGLGDEVLGAATEDARARHLRYAEGVDHLHVLAWSGRDPAPVSLSPKLTVYPIGRRGRLHFAREALQVGGELLRRRPVRVVSTQEPFYTAAVGLRLRRAGLSAGVGLAGVRLQIQNHSDFFDNSLWIAERPLTNRVLNAFGKWAVRQADRLRVVNRLEQQKYGRLGIAADRVDVLPVPVDLAALARPVDGARLETLRRQLNLAPEAAVLLWVGRPVPFKDLGTLLRAVSRVCRERPDTTLVLGGDFSGAARWPALAAELGLDRQVRYVGPIARADLPDYFALCQVYVHASMYEGFGRVMLEASAAGRPLAATRTAGAADIVRENETGLLCEPRSPEALARIILDLLADPDRAQRLGAAGRSWAQAQFDPGRLTAGILAAWRQTADS